MSATILFLLLSAVSSARTLESLHRSASAPFDGLRGREMPAPGPARPQAPLSLSDLARAFANDPAAVDELLDLIVAKAGPLGGALDTPRRREELKRALRAADPAVLDRFPTLSLAALAQAGELYASRLGVLPEPARPAQLALALPGAPADPPRGAFLKPLGRGLYYGDESLIGGGPAWGDSKAVAEALNQLAAGGRLADAGRAHGSIAEWLGALLAEGHALEVEDRRMYANFGDLRFEAGGARRDVATPTLVDTGLALPSGRRLIVPVTHSELEAEIRGPRVRARVTWFFGIDGRAVFRALETVDQGWVGGRTVKSWAGADAAAILERAGWVSRELAAKAKALALPAGGYGPLGDCNDAQAFVTGDTPLGMLRDPRLFAGQGPLDVLSRSLPYDRTAPVDPRRVWDSRAFERPEDVPMPEVRAAMAELRGSLP